MIIRDLEEGDVFYRVAGGVLPVAFMLVAKGNTLSLVRVFPSGLEFNILSSTNCIKVGRVHPQQVMYET